MIYKFNVNKDGHIVFTHEQLIQLPDEVYNTGYNGSNLARQYEFKEMGLPSPVMNKSINDKTNMTEEENNCLAEKIVAADTDRLWNSDMCSEQSAMFETGILYGWKYMVQKLMDIINADREDNRPKSETLDKIIDELIRIGDFMEHLNEGDK